MANSALLDQYEEAGLSICRTNDHDIKNNAFTYSRLKMTPEQVVKLNEFIQRFFKTHGYQAQKDSPDENTESEIPFKDYSNLGFHTEASSDDNAPTCKKVDIETNSHSKISDVAKINKVKSDRNETGNDRSLSEIDEENEGVGFFKGTSIRMEIRLKLDEIMSLIYYCYKSEIIPMNEIREAFIDLGNKRLDVLIESIETYKTKINMSMKLNTTEYNYHDQATVYKITKHLREIRKVEGVIVSLETRSGKTTIVLNVVNAEMFEEALRMSGVQNRSLAYILLYPSNSRFPILVPVYGDGYIKRKDGVESIIILLPYDTAIYLTSSYCPVSFNCRKILPRWGTGKGYWTCGSFYLSAKSCTSPETPTSSSTNRFCMVKCVILSTVQNIWALFSHLIFLIDKPINRITTNAIETIGSTKTHAAIFDSICNHVFKASMSAFHTFIH